MEEERSKQVVRFTKSLALELLMQTLWSSYLEYIIYKILTKTCYNVHDPPTLHNSNVAGLLVCLVDGGVRRAISLNVPLNIKAKQQISRTNFVRNYFVNPNNLITKTLMGFNGINLEKWYVLFYSLCSFQVTFSCALLICMCECLSEGQRRQQSFQNEQSAAKANQGNN